jgi:hypothetical protein
MQSPRLSTAKLASGQRQGEEARGWGHDQTATTSPTTRNTAKALVVSTNALKAAGVG